MGILEFLGINEPTRDSSENGVESIRQISRKLEEMDVERARYLAAFAYMLGRVAHADLEISDEEGAKMESILMEKASLPHDQAVMILEIAKQQNRLFGHVENFLVTREFNTVASRRQKLDLLDCLFAVCAADRSISTVEDREIRQIASELLLEHREFIQTRSRYRDSLDFLKSSTEQSESE